MEEKTGVGERGDAAWSGEEGLETGCPVQGRGRRSWLPEHSATFSNHRSPTGRRIERLPLGQPPSLPCSCPTALHFGPCVYAPNTVPWVQRVWSHLHALEVSAPPPPVLPGLYHQFHVLHDSPEKGIENMHMWEAGEGRIKKPSSRQWDRT